MSFEFPKKYSCSPPLHGCGAFFTDFTAVMQPSRSRHANVTHIAFNMRDGCVTAAWRLRDGYVTAAWRLRDGCESVQAVTQPSRSRHAAVTKPSRSRHAAVTQPLRRELVKIGKNGGSSTMWGWRAVVLLWKSKNICWYPWHQKFLLAHPHFLS